MAPRTAAGQLHALFLHPLLLIRQYRLLVIGRRLALHKGDGTGGTGRKVVAQTVAVVVPHQFRFPVHHGDGSLVAGLGAGAAAVAFISIDFNDSSFHDSTSLAFLTLL